MITENKFASAPVRIVIYDPTNDIVAGVKVILGAVPARVAAAATNWASSAGKKRAEYEKTLRAHYGPDYKRKLVLCDSDKLLWWHDKEAVANIERTREGGHDDDSHDDDNDTYIDPGDILAANTYWLDEEPDQIVGGDDETIDDISRLLKRASEKSVVEKTAIKYDGIEYVTDVTFYPEDKLNETKDKIFLATGIPSYRQHVFYFDRGLQHIFYRIIAEGLHPVDIRTLGQKVASRIHGAPIDRFLYETRDEIRIEAMDNFTLLGDALGPAGRNATMAHHTLYVVDIAQFIDQQRSQIIASLSNKFTMDLYYFGFVIKYWPQLTQEVFYDYLMSEAELQHKYPDLARSETALANIYYAEQQIIDKDYRCIGRIRRETMMAITSMVATTVNVAQINMRGLFDALKVSQLVPEIYGFIIYQNDNYILRKRHASVRTNIVFPSSKSIQNSITLAVSTKRGGSVATRGNSGMATGPDSAEYLFLSIVPTGRYYIRATWREEDEVGFDDAVNIIKKYCDPVITAINQLGRRVFVAGGTLPLITKSNLQFQSLSVAVFWRRVMPDSAWRALKELWQPYMRARIIGARNVAGNVASVYEFLWRKGMHLFDDSNIARIVSAAAGVNLTNYYAHLSNNTIKQKWDQNYDGRIARMSQKMTSIKFEITDVLESEFELFYRFVLMFIDRAKSDTRISSPVTQYTGKIKKLRKLQEQDPELFNLKKHGSDRIYSMSCQKPKQPIIYTADEIKAMTPAQVAKLTKYWNFTLNKPAYYGCPSAKYPHLTFTVDIHPLHYCLPCCGLLDGPESRSAQLTSICLKDRIYPLISSQNSRHVITYGKIVDPGRVSRVPPSIRSLFFNVSSRDYSMGLAGVPSHLGDLNTSIVNAVAEALDETPTALLMRGTQLLAKTPSRFATLAGGTAIKSFASMDELVAGLRAITAGRPSPSFDNWIELFSEMFFMLDIRVMTFIDEAGDGSSPKLFIGDDLKAEIEGRAGAPPGARYVLLMKTRDMFYPIFLFKNEPLVAHQKTWTSAESVPLLLFGMLPSATRITRVSLRPDIVTAVVPGYVITRKYINRANQCYGLLLKPDESNVKSVYVPVVYSLTTADGIESSYCGLAADEDLPFAELARYIGAYNDFMTRNKVGHLVVYAPIVIDKIYIRGLTASETVPSSSRIFETTISDFDSEKWPSTAVSYAVSCDNMMYYYNDTPVIDVVNMLKKIGHASGSSDSSSDTASDSSIAPAVTITAPLYDYREVNSAIMKREEPAKDGRANIGTALYNNYVYQLFVIEFVNFLSAERNAALRAELAEVFAPGPKFGDITQLRRLLKKHPVDFTAVMQRLQPYYYGGATRKEVLDAIMGAIYDFDRMTLARLKTLPMSETITELEKIASAITTEGELPDVISFPNVYLPCDSDPIPESAFISELPPATYCVKRRLVLRPGTRRALVELLAADVHDDLKSRYMMNSLFADSVVDYFTFEKQPDESVTIYLV